MGNTEAIAINYYLQETGQHLADACTVSTVKMGAHTGADTAVMSPQSPSEKTETLENKAYHVMSYHDMPAIGRQVGDEGLEPPTSTV